MTIRFSPFAPEHMPEVQRFGGQVWQRPRGDAFYRWRYLEAPTQRAFLALRDGKCLAILCAFARPYRLGAEQRTCLEIHDWYCVPELRSSGLGIQLMRRAMAGPEPIVAIDGTDDTVSLLPRLGFRALAPVGRYSLPVSGSAFGGALAKRLRAPAWIGRAAFELGPRAWFRPRRRCVPRGGRAVRAAGVPGDLQPLYAGATGYGTLPLWEEAHLAWLVRGFPGVGEFVSLRFLVDERLRGWGLLRVFESAGERHAVIVELFAPEPDTGLYAWLVSEAVVCAASFGPTWIRAQTSCPWLRAALRANRFLEAGEAPVHLWWSRGEPPPGPVHVGFDGADGPLLPYPEP